MVQVTSDNYVWTITLGELIGKLNTVQSTLPVYLGVLYDNPGKPYSYRGYYDNLAIGTCLEEKTAGAFVEELEAACGESYTGYKGGSYYMDYTTSIWASEYGSASGIGIVDVHCNDSYCVIVTAEVD